MSPVAHPQGGVAVHWHMSIKHTTSKYVLRLLLSLKFCAFMSSLVPSSTLVDLNGKHSPDRGWRAGSIPTLGQALDSNCAVMSLTQLCLIEGKAPFGQPKACATENTSHMESARVASQASNHVSNKAHLWRPVCSARDHTLSLEWQSHVGPISWFSPYQIILANQIWPIRSPLCHVHSVRTCTNLVRKSLTCKRSCLYYRYSTFEIKLCTCGRYSTNVLQHLSGASFRFFHHWRPAGCDFQLSGFRMRFLVDMWSCSDLTGHYYLEWQEPRNWSKDTRQSSLRPFC